MDPGGVVGTASGAPVRRIAVSQILFVGNFGLVAITIPLGKLSAEVVLKLRWKAQASPNFPSTRPTQGLRSGITNPPLGPNSIPVIVTATLPALVTVIILLSGVLG